MTKFRCLRTEILSAGDSFPVLVGYLSAGEILGIAEVPHLSALTDHSEIAEKVLKPPVKEWQRPLDLARVARIAAVFNDSGDIMPNPVLLSQNTLDHPAGVTIEQEMAAGAVPTKSWIVTVTDSLPDQAKPLWILDGQHRINGLAQSVQHDIPFHLYCYLT